MRRVRRREVELLSKERLEFRDRLYSLRFTDRRGNGQLQIELFTALFVRIIQFEGPRLRPIVVHAVRYDCVHTTA